jgi:hypothetical protein
LGNRLETSAVIGRNVGWEIGWQDVRKHVGYQVGNSLVKGMGYNGWIMSHKSYNRLNDTLGRKI